MYSAKSLPAKKLISLTNKIFRSASNTFLTSDFVCIGEQEILPLKSLVAIRLYYRVV